MTFKNVKSGVLYNVTNEALVAYYKNNDCFVEVAEEKKPAEKKTTVKK